MRIFPNLSLKNLKGDVFGGLTAAVVVLPLALAFGVASGAGPVAGVYGAIFTGFFAAMFGGTKGQITGPTGPIIVITAAIFTKFSAEPALAFSVFMLAGLLQILFATMRLGELIMLVPYTVISGFMSGVGAIIVLVQLAPLLGHDVMTGEPLRIAAAIPDMLSNVNWQTVAVGAITLLLVTLTPKRLRHLVPPAAIALIGGTVIAAVFLPGVPTLREIPTGLPHFVMPDISFFRLGDMLGSALALALIASIDSLLTALIADHYTHGRNKPNHELAGQGIGNVMAGLFGAIPGAAITAVTVANIKSGGRTALAGMIAALVLLALMLGLAPLASHIPQSVLAGYLISVGASIIDWRYFFRGHKGAPLSLALMLLVFFLTVFVDVIVAVGVGIAAAGIIFLERMAQVRLKRRVHRPRAWRPPEPDLSAEEQRILEKNREHIIFYHFGGPVHLGVARGMIHRLFFHDEHVVLVLDFSEVEHLDKVAALSIRDMIRRAHDLDMDVIATCMGGAVTAALQSVGAFAIIPPSLRFEDRLAGLRMAEEISHGRKTGKIIQRMISGNAA